MKPNVVYDVPLLRSLQQQLCDRHILKEVLYVYTHSTHVLTHTIHTYMHKHIGTIKQNNLNNSYYVNHYTVCKIALKDGLTHCQGMIKFTCSCLKIVLCIDGFKSTVFQLVAFAVT